MTPGQLRARYLDGLRQFERAARDIGKDWQYLAALRDALGVGTTRVSQAHATPAQVR
jgi:hypothetical protein